MATIIPQAPPVAPATMSPIPPVATNLTNTKLATDMATEVSAAMRYCEFCTFLLWRPRSPTRKNEAVNSIIYWIMLFPF